MRRAKRKTRKLANIRHTHEKHEHKMDSYINI